MVIIEVLKSKLTEEIDLKPRKLTSKAPRKRRARRSTKEINQNYVSDNQAKESSEGQKSEEKASEEEVVYEKPKKRIAKKETKLESKIKESAKDNFKQLPL